MVPLRSDGKKGPLILQDLSMASQKEVYQLEVLFPEKLQVPIWCRPLHAQQKPSEESKEGSCVAAVNV